MRILFVHSGSDLYGASRSLLRLTTHLVTDGHAVAVVLPHEGPLLHALRSAGADATVDDRLVVMTRHGIADHRGYTQQLVDLPRSVSRLMRLVRRFQPDLIHTNTAVVISSALAAKLARVPHVWHIREFFVDFPRLWPYHRRFMTGFSSRIICVSGAVARQFGPHSSVEVLHNGFPSAEFAQVDTSRSAAFRRVHRLDNRTLVGIVGRIKFKRKGQETFVRAAAMLVNAHPDTRFLVIGSPFPGNEDHLVRLQHLIAELGIDDRVILTGDVEDIKAVYSALDVAVLASSSPEPFGGVVIEAMALGKPVVGTRVGGTPEQIEHGVTGLLVPPDAPREMAEAIDALLRDPELRARMGAAGRSRFLREFEFAPFYRRLTQTYDDVIRGVTRRRAPGT